MYIKEVREDIRYLRNPMFINLSSIARVLSVQPSSIRKFWHLSHSVCVLLKNGTRRIIARKAFLTDAIALRKSGALGSSVQHDSGNWFTVQRHDKPGVHLVNMGCRPRCDCKDFQNQAQNGNGFTAPVCSHLFAVQFYLGHASLRECLASRAA